MRLNAKQTDVKFVGKRKHRISNSGPVARFGVVVRDRGARMHRFKRSGLAAVKLIEDAPRFSRYASKKQIARRTMQTARLGRFPSITEISPERTTSATADLNRYKCRCGFGTQRFLNSAHIKICATRRSNTARAQNCTPFTILRNICTLWQ